MDRANSRQLFQYSLLILLAVGLLWVWSVLHKADTLPLKYVKVEGTYLHVSQQEIQNAVKHLVTSGFFSVNVSGLKHHLLKLPWVASVSIARLWPDTLKIRIREQQALAQWGNDSLLNPNGELFTPRKETLPPGLPELVGPLGLEKQVLHQYQNMSKMLSPKGMQITQVVLTARRSWQLGLSNGITVLLGNNKPLQRLERFITTYNKIFGTHASEAKIVDLRYPNGIAVSWKNGHHPRTEK